jgi:hypothetical protein
MRTGRYGGVPVSSTSLCASEGVRGAGVPRSAWWRRSLLFVRQAHQWALGATGAGGLTSGAWVGCGRCQLWCQLVFRVASPPCAALRQPCLSDAHETPAIFGVLRFGADCCAGALDASTA